MPLAPAAASRSRVTGREDLSRSDPRSAKGRVSAHYLVLPQLFDGRLVETVGIPADADGGGRLTVCVSSQVTVKPPRPMMWAEAMYQFWLLL